MDLAVDRGINVFDTAELYPIPPKAGTQGRTEEIIGAWFERTGKRDDIVLATKVVGRSGNTWLRDDERPPRLAKVDLEEACDKSLKRLKTDYIDLYQVHWPDRTVARFGANPTRYEPPERARDEVPIEETLGALGDLVEAGKVRHIGLSNENPWGLMRYLALADASGLPRVQTIQNAYSLVNRTFEVGLAEVAEREDVGLLAYSALAQGYLTGKYRGGALPQGSRKQLFDRLQRYETEGSAEAFDRYLDLAEEHGLDPAQMAIRFVMDRPFTTSVILGATSVDQLKVDLGAADITLGDDVLEAIDRLHQWRGNPCP